jgi:hypothetical protein
MFSGRCSQPALFLCVQQGALHSIIAEKTKLQHDVQQLRVLMGTREKELSDLKARLVSKPTHVTPM